MKITSQEIKSTEAKYLVSASLDEMSKFKLTAINHSKNSVKVPGFRPGKAPVEMIEKYLDPAKLQNDFLNEIINDLYLKSIDELDLRTVNEPSLNITKFVPYTTLEFSVSVDIVTKVTVADYSKLDIKLEQLPVTKQQIETTLTELRSRTAKISEVDRAAKLGDQLLIDFKASDFKTKKALPQATGQDYKLVLGSNNFVPGFEDKLVGRKKDDQVSFSLTFPASYHDAAFKSRKVTFDVTIQEVSSVELPKLDDAFAASLGPFKSVKEFETELNRQIKVENEHQATRQFEDKILNKLAETTKVEIPASLIESETNRLEADAKQSALYRGQSWPEFLSSIDTDQQGYIKQLKPLAELRIKGGLAIGEIAKANGIEVSQNDLETQIVALKEQYTDPQMRTELDSPNNRREILMRLLSEKVLEHIKQSLSIKTKVSKK